MNIYKLIKLVMFLKQVLRDGKVDDEEFIQLLEILDLNKDGKLSTREIKNAVRELF